MNTKRIFPFLVLAFLFTVSFVLNGTAKNSARAAETKVSSVDLGYTFALKQTIPLLAQNITYPNDAFFDQATNNLYYISVFTSGQVSLMQLNLSTGSTAVLANFSMAGKFSMTPNGRYLYFAEGTSPITVHIYDTVSKQVIRTISYGSDWVDFIVTDDNRLFILTSTSLDMVSGTTGGLIKSVPIIGGNGFSRNFALSPDQNSLYMIANFKVFKFDITLGDLKEILRTAEIEDYRSITISNDGSYILVTPIYGEWIYRLNPDTLTLADTYTYRLNTDYTWDMRASANSTTFYGLWGDGLQEINVISNQPVRELRNSSLYAQAVLPVNNNRVALLYSDKVELLIPTSYGVALPNVMSNYCAAPLVDDFSDPSSGWPVAVSGSTTYRYLSGEYNILLAEANRWSAASAGHVLDNSKLLRVEGRIANNQDGSYGFIYGLNSDWTDFYTFEVYPQYRGWAIFHYEQAKGWQLVTNNTLNQINITGKNTLEIASNSDSMSFYINKIAVHYSGQQTGRVGLTGTSLQPNVDIRYDNYVLVGEYCPIPAGLSSNQALINSFSLERPSPETFPSNN